MKFTCSQLALSKAVNTVSKAISSRTTIPILKGILFELEGDTLKLTSSNLDLTIETKIQVQGAEDGKLIVDSKLFSEIVRRLPNSMVTVFSDENGALRLQCLGSDYSFVCFPADEYPSTGSVEEIKKIAVDKKGFCELVKRTSFAASIDEKKGILIGCLMDFTPEKIEMVALDGFRMSIANLKLQEPGIEAKVVIPARMMADISKLLGESDGDEQIVISIDEKKLQIVCDDTVIIARLLIGDFLNYKDILPKTHKTRFTAARAELQGSLERASLFAKEGQNNLIKFTVSGGKVQISSRSEEGNVNEQVLCETEGDDLVIGFNSKYILEVLKAVDDEEIVFDLIDSTSCCLVKPAEGDDYLFFILPVRIVTA